MTTGQTIAAIVFVTVVGTFYVLWTRSAFKYERARRTDWRVREPLDGTWYEVAWGLWMFLHILAAITTAVGGLTALGVYAWGTP